MNVSIFWTKICFDEWTRRHLPSWQRPSSCNKLDSSKTRTVGVRRSSAHQDAQRLSRTMAIFLLIDIVCLCFYEYCHLDRSVQACFTRWLTKLYWIKLHCRWFGRAEKDEVKLGHVNILSNPQKVRSYTNLCDHHHHRELPLIDD